jgi:acid phosphatase
MTKLRISDQDISLKDYGKRIRVLTTFVALVLFITACSIIPSQGGKITAPIPTPGATPTLSQLEARIPVFDHIIMIMFENQDYQQVIGNNEMPTFNQLASQNVLLTNYYAVTHPSLPNYIALIGGDTFGIINNCTDCFIDHPSLPDLIEASNLTWRTYQEDLPSPCFVGNSGEYVQKHNPFIYFDPIRNNADRCKHDVVSLKELDQDLAANQLPNFAFIMPNLCDTAHRCSLNVADQWLKQIIQKLISSQALGQTYLIYISFEESKGDTSSCCGLSAKAGGRVAAILISPQAKSGYKDDTPLSHYSMLKTILISWKLSGLGFTEKSTTQAITAPWK